jgi:hypothetical protein
MRKELRMADSETLLQLGIDAAREGRRDDARNLFGLLTRQDPNNSQAWLWLAGVAEGPEQRRAALEHVVELDPSNEMAIKGLQAMGAAPSVRPSVPVDTEIPDAPPVTARDMTDEERYAAELDSAFDDYDTVPRAESPRRDIDDAEMLGSTVAADRPSASRTPPRGTARERSAARRTTTPIRSDDDDDDLYGPPPRRGISPLALGLLALIVLALAGYLVWSLLFNRGTQVATQPGAATTTAIANATSVAGGGGTGAALPTEVVPGGATGPLTGTGSLTDTGTLTDTTPLTDTAPLQPTTAAPPPAGPAGAIPAPQANPNLQPVEIGAQLQANGWTYTWPAANYVVVLGKQVGNFTAQGTYLHVLVWVANNSGTDQPLPANFFALKDASNTVYNAAPQVSSVAVQRGFSADAGMEDPIPANGVLTSVYLVFDVQPGAQGLTLFASGNNGQGWPLNVVP